MAKLKKCPECTSRYEEVDDLYEHLEDKHNDVIPKGWSGGRYFYFTKYHRGSGQCVVCGKETKWNEVTNKPYRICSPACRKTYRENFLNNMRKVHGKDHLLDDPEMQKKMLSQRSISGEYEWHTGERKQYVGSYEKDFLQFLNVFMNFEADDVHAPAPQIIEYEYAGKKHFYIPDFYIESINTIVEIKDGGDNPNTHHKIQEVDKEKERAKDEAISKDGRYNYIKIVDKKYAPFIKFLIQIKNAESEKKEKFRPVILINENLEMIQESLKPNKDLFIAVIREELEGLSENDTSYSVWFSFDNVFSKAFKAYRCTDENGNNCAKFMEVDKAALIGEQSFNIMKIKDTSTVQALYERVKQHQENPYYCSETGLELFHLYDELSEGRCFQSVRGKHQLNCGELIHNLQPTFQYITRVPNLDAFNYEDIIANNSEAITSSIQSMDVDALYEMFIGSDTNEILSEEVLSMPSEDNDEFDSSTENQKRQYESFIRDIGKTNDIVHLNKLGGKIKEFKGDEDDKASLMRRLAQRKDQILKFKN